METIGIIIPARNEEQCIERCLISLRPFFDARDIVVIVNACSEDRTVKMARHYPVSIVESQSPARGRAIARGFRYLQNEYLQLNTILIAHADMQFPADARSRFLEFVDRYPNYPGGSFGHRIESNVWQYRLMEWGNAFRASWLQMPYGDQVQFLRKDRLLEVGGFPDQDELEDVELSLRLQRAGRLAYLNIPVLIPTRHWDDGIIKTTLRNWKIVQNYRKQKQIPIVETKSG